MPSVNPGRVLWAVVLLTSACSEVNLNYGLAGSRLSLIGTASPTDSILADLQILAQVQSEQLNLERLQLRIRLRRPGADPTAEAEQTLQIVLSDFLSQPALLLDQLRPGPAALDITLLDADQQSLSAFETMLDLQPGSSLDVRFALGADSTGVPEIRLQTVTPRGGQPDRPDAATSETTPNTPATTEPLSAGPENPSPTAGTRGGNTAQPTGPRYELNPRLLEQGSNSLVMIWDAPPDSAGVQGYQIRVNGRIVADNHPLANYRLEGLNSGNSYAIEIAPVLADGTVLAPSPLSGSTRSSGGGGGGGGGGATGGGTTNPPAAPPTIDSIQASRTTVAGLAYPVQLTAALANGQSLPDAAYSWQCNNCGDASFSANTGAQVTWNAPTTPGTYEVTLTVNDGTHPPVSENISITVQHGQVNVNVIGDYR
ncbi:MAG: PKD domain-containing protein [Candidatus Sericytochromatia bacterium]|nr:PKD domain-containing protein [Candidatus Sericytochromatia bacterium]